MIFTIHADGGARGNPGPAGAGATIRDATGSIVARISKFLGHQTNNFAEYEAVILAFQELATLLPAENRSQTSVIVKMDSELVVKQVNKMYKVKHPIMKEQFARLAHIASAFKKVSFVHIPRAENSDADALANAAMDHGVS